LESNGGPDTTFTINTDIGGIGSRDLALQVDGRILAVISNSIYRFNTNGSRDDSFRQPVFLDANFNPAVPGTPVSVHLLPDGRVLIGGGFTDVDPPGAPTYSHFGVTRLNSDGTLDATLVTNHKTGVETTPTSFARLDDGSTLVGGSNLTNSNDKLDPPLPYNVTRLLSDGSRDPNFTLSSSDQNSFLSGGFLARGFEPLPDGNFFVFGPKTSYAFTYGKVAPNGEHDTSFPTEPIHHFQEAIAAPDGKILLSAGTDPQATVYTPLERLGADGHLDSLFAPQWIRDDQVHRNSDFNSMIFRLYVGSRVLAIQPDGKILFEYFGDFLGSNFNFHVIRLNSDGSNSLRSHLTRSILWRVSRSSLIR
jgi:uncharacterized delta-60 repeat protein